MKNFVSKILFLFLPCGMFFWGETVLAWDVEGTIRVNGTPKPRYGGVRPEERQICGGMVKQMEDLMAGPGGELKNAVVWVEGEMKAADMQLAEEALNQGVPLIDQVKCQYTPRVVLVPPGGQVIFKSSDSTIHNVAGFLPTGKNAFDMMLKDPSQFIQRRFTEPGPHYMRCGFHPWMGAVVFVRSHPFYAITDEKGRYKISGLRAGNYRLKVWHETLGEREAAVTPSRAQVNVLYDRPKK